MQLRVTSLHDPSDRVRSFELRALDDGPLPSWQPGAHLAVQLEGLTRRYSLISDRADRSVYAIAVLRVTEGRGSGTLHDDVAVGSVLTVTGPHHDFTLRPTAPSALVAGGIGITPLLSMARELAARGEPFELHYAARTASDLLFADELRALTPRAFFYLGGRKGSAPMDPAALVSALEPSTSIYACGPRALLEGLRTAVRAHGRSASVLHLESFGSSGGPRRRRPLAVWLAQSNLQLQVLPEQNLLDALLEAGAFLGYECRRGECGSCAVRVIEGDVNHADICLTEAARTDQMCPCVSTCRSDRLVLDL